MCASSVGQQWFWSASRRCRSCAAPLPPAMRAPPPLLANHTDGRSGPSKHFQPFTESQQPVPRCALRLPQTAQHQTPHSAAARELAARWINARRRAQSNMQRREADRRFCNPPPPPPPPPPLLPLIASLLLPGAAAPSRRLSCPPGDLSSSQPHPPPAAAAWTDPRAAATRHSPWPRCAVRRAPPALRRARAPPRWQLGWALQRCMAPAATRSM